eukprot:Hpha_TRINITY_DN14806_c0_g3::TRINITY_DN14806_c0_g3_i1::g.170079::m.170079
MATNAAKKVTDNVGPTCLADIAKGINVNGDCGYDAHTPPAWLDHDRYDAGRKVFEQNCARFVINWHFSLVFGFAIKPFIQALIFTGQSSTPADAGKRYMNTYKMLAIWHLGDIFDDSKTMDGVSAFDAVATVRTYHKTVRARMQAALPDTATYMNSYDMALVQTGFMGALVIGGATTGMTQQKIDDYCYFWRCVAHQLGVDDKYNLCGQGNPAATNITWEIVNQVLMPSEEDPPEPDYDTLVNAYLDYMNEIIPIPIWSQKAMVAATYLGLGKIYIGLGKIVKLSLADKLRIVSYGIVMLIVYLPGLSYIVNKIAMYYTKRMIKDSPCERGGVCPVMGVMKDEEMQGLKNKCHGARSMGEGETRMQRFTRKAQVLGGAFFLFVMLLFYIAIIVGGIVYATHLALQYAR